MPVMSMAIYWLQAQTNMGLSFSDRRASTQAGNRARVALMLHSSRLIGTIEKCFVRLANEASPGCSVKQRSHIRGESSKLSLGAKTVSIVKIALAAYEVKRAHRVNYCCKPRSFRRRSKKLAPCSPAKKDAGNISNAPALKERFRKLSGAAP